MTWNHYHTQNFKEAEKFINEAGPSSLAGIQCAMSNGKDIHLFVEHQTPGTQYQVWHLLWKGNAKDEILHRLNNHQVALIGFDYKEKGQQEPNSIFYVVDESGASEAIGERV